LENGNFPLKNIPSCLISLSLEYDREARLGKEECDVIKSYLQRDEVKRTLRLFRLKFNSPISLQVESVVSCLQDLSELCRLSFLYKLQLSYDKLSTVTGFSSQFGSIGNCNIADVSGVKACIVS
jgi:hypothetical protein